MTLSAFIEMWAKGVDSFKADPPNATLSVLKEEGVENVVVELISVEQKSDSVVFEVDVLDDKLPAAFGPAAIFLDADIVLHYVNESNDPNNSSVVIFQKNVATDF